MLARREEARTLSKRGARILNKLRTRASQRGGPFFANAATGSGGSAQKEIEKERDRGEREEEEE